MPNEKDYLIELFFQPNPFLPDGEVAKDAQSLLEKMKTKKNSYNTLECKSKLLFMITFCNLSCRFLNSNLNYDCSSEFYLRNLQEQVRKNIVFQKFFLPFTVQRNCASDFKTFANS